MTRNLLVPIACLLLALSPSVLAHPRATTVENPDNGERCYVYSNDGIFEFWMESNGFIGGPPGVEEGLPAGHLTEEEGPFSGLQRGASAGPDKLLGTADDIPADDGPLNPALWAARCGLATYVVIVGTSASVWQETNGVGGLQTAWSCPRLGAGASNTTVGFALDPAGSGPRTCSRTYRAYDAVTKSWMPRTEKVAAIPPDTLVA
ncbi:MAG: hypothetical protein ACT4PT_08880 [Methanobacteriota archaeon]